MARTVDIVCISSHNKKMMVIVVIDVTGRGYLVNGNAMKNVLENINDIVDYVCG